jgi:DNA-binding NarL/FixJ family response regulator
VPTTVLIVDDHAPFRALAGQLLGAAGFEVVGEAGDGLTALAINSDLRPDVILLDIQLPDIDGFEVIRRLRAQGVAPNVVLTSSRDAADYADAVAASGTAGFIPKADLSGAALSDLLPDCA